MNQNDCPKDEAFGEVEKRVSDAWKDINEECLQPTSAAMPILLRIVNAARVIHILYKDHDGYTDSKSKLKDVIKAVLIEPLST